MIRPAHPLKPVRYIDLCFGYFDDDYKVIRIAVFSGGKEYQVGVYSLSTNAWKITRCDSNSTTYKSNYNTSSNRFVSGAAYFVNYDSKIICFDLHHERSREVQFPDKFDSSTRRRYSVEACGESIALVEIREYDLIMWVLRNCAASNSSIWERMVTIELETIPTYPRGFTKHGKYLLSYYDGEDRVTNYLWDFGTSRLEKCVSYKGTEDPGGIDHLVGNLVLLDEKNLDPFMGTKPYYSTQIIFVLDKLRSKRVKDMADTTWNKMQRKGTKRRKEDTVVKSRKRGRKIILGKRDTEQNKRRGTHKWRNKIERQSPLHLASML
ncbi:hypothetical protein AgCh_007381 [Apium graveolens]